MADVREQILARLQILAAQVDGIATGDNTVKATVGVKPVGKITYAFD